MADRMITVSMELDYKGLERELTRLQKKIDGLKASLLQKEAGRSSQTRQASLSDGAKKYSQEITTVLKLLASAEAKAGAVVKELAAAGDEGGKMGEAVRKSGGYLDKFKAGLKAVAKHAGFNLLVKGLSLLGAWMERVVMANGAAGTALAKLKGALLTLVQPLAGIVVPVFVTLVQVLTQVVSVIAQVMTALFGGTIGQSKAAAEALYQETNAIEGTGAAAKKASRQLAAFDELNVLTDDSGGGGGSGGGGAQGVDFDFGPELSEGQTEGILQLIGLVGAGLLAWKLSPDLSKGLLNFVGWLAVIEGAILLVQGTFDAWQEGLSWDNLTDILLGTGTLVAGLGVIFGKTGLAVGLVATGVLNLITAFHDMMENGMNWQNTLLAIAGLLGAGLGISLLTGSFIPLLIAGIASAVLAIVNAFGDGEMLLAGFQGFLSGFRDFIVGIFTGDIGLALEGVGQIFDGLGTIFNTVIEAIKNMFLSFLDWLNEKTNGRFKPIIDTIAYFVTGTFQVIQDTIRGVIEGIKLIFTGLIEFLTGVFTGDWDKAWEGVKNIFKGVFNGIVSLLEGAVNLIINGINWIIEKINSIAIHIPDNPITGPVDLSPNIKLLAPLKLPRLAAGAVIPPNREFMAVLGDQRYGTNLEAPEGLIRKIVREESGGAAILPELREILAAIREGKILMVDKRVLGRTVQESITSAARAGGTAFIPGR